MEPLRSLRSQDSRPSIFKSFGCIIYNRKDIQIPTLLSVAELIRSNKNRTDKVSLEKVFCSRHHWEIKLLLAYSYCSSQHIHYGSGDCKLQNSHNHLRLTAVFLLPSPSFSSTKTFRHRYSHTYLSVVAIDMKGNFI